jgi:oxaloacetate decarboxylase alpha subunit
MTSINTAIPPLADGSSNPSIFNVARNAKAMGYAPVIDEEPIRPVAAHFTAIAKREKLTIGKPPEYDYAQYVHQIPGGMISNLRHQLRLVGMEDKLERTLDEAAQVRAEFGYPIMVTPLSQFVGSQAAINVIVGERYKEVTDQSIEYALGVWGKEGGALMDPDIKDKILSRRRADEIARRELPQMSLQELRRKFGGAGVSDEEILLRFFTSKEDVDKMRAAGPARLYSNGNNTLIRLLEELTKPTNRTNVFIRRGPLTVRLDKKTASSLNSGAS